MIDLYESLVGNNQPASYKVENKPITCTHCHHNLFVKSSAMLNTAAMTFLGLDWANKTAQTLICSNCGQVLWFLRPK